MLSSCGLLCETCYAFPKDCPGCDKLEGKPSWVSDIGKSVCELYQCARDRGITSCGGCAVLPCRQFVELRDPSLSVEEHLGHVNKRAEKLKKAYPSALSSFVHIIPRDAFYVIGYPLATTTERSRSEVPAFWDRFFEFGGPDKLGKIAEQERGGGIYGVCTDFNCKSGEFTYVIGVDVSKPKDMPEGMVQVSVPAALYAVASAVLDAPAIHEAWDFLIKTWMPEAGYSHAGTEDFEFYPEECGCEVWVPIK